MGNFSDLWDGFIRCRTPSNQWQCSFHMKAALPLAKRLARTSECGNNAGPYHIWGSILLSPCQQMGQHLMALGQLQTHCWLHYWWLWIGFYISNNIKMTADVLQYLWHLSVNQAPVIIVCAYHRCAHPVTLPVLSGTYLSIHIARLSLAWDYGNDANMWVLTLCSNHS